MNIVCYKQMLVFYPLAEPQQAEIYINSLCKRGAVKSLTGFRFLYLRVTSIKDRPDFKCRENIVPKFIKNLHHFLVPFSVLLQSTQLHAVRFSATTPHVNIHHRLGAHHLCMLWSCLMSGNHAVQCHVD